MRGNAAAAIPRLAQVLTDDPAPEVRQMAAVALGALGDGTAEALESIRAAILKDDSDIVRGAAIRCLQPLGPRAKPAVPELVRALADTNSGNRSDAALALGWIRSDAEEALPALAGVLRDAQQPTILRINAAISLGRIGSAEAAQCLPDIVALVDSPDKHVRVGFIMAVSEFGPSAKSVAHQLTCYLSDPDPMVRTMAAGTFYDIGSPELNDAIPILVAMLSDPDDGVRGNAALSLGAAVPAAIDALPALRNLLSDPFPEVRARAEGAIQSIEQPAREQELGID